MKTIHNSCIFFLVFLLTASSAFTHCQRTSWQQSQARSNLAIGGVVGLCVGGIMAAGDKISNWFNDSNNTIIEQAQKVFAGRSAYESIRSQTKISYGIENSWISDCMWIKDDINEDLLYKIAYALWNAHKKPQNFFWEFKTYIKDLSFHREQLITRINKLSTNSYVDMTTSQELQIMRSLLSDIESWYAEFQALYSYLDYHRSFFELAYIEWHVYKDYKQEVAAFNTCAHDSYRLSQELTAIVQRKYSTSAYPSIVYTQQLEMDMQKIRYVRNHVVHNYTERFKWTDACINKLETLRAMIDRWYKDELLKHNHTRLIEQKESALHDQKEELRRLKYLQKHSSGKDKYISHWNSRENLGTITYM